MIGGSISNSAKVSNALVATNGGSITISGTTITSTEVLHWDDYMLHMAV